MRLLTIRYRKLGDALMVTPIIQSLRHAGVESINVLGEVGFERVFTTMPEVDGFLAASGPEPSRWELAKLGIKARRFRCDTAIVLRFDRKAAIAARFAGCRTRIGSAKKCAKGALALTQNLYVPSGWECLHQVEKYYAVADEAVPGLVRFPTRYLPLDEERARALRTLGALPMDYAVVHVGNGGSNLAWTDADFATCIAELKKLGLSVVVSGAKNDAPSYPITRKAGDLDLVGKTDLDSIMELMRGARVVVALDGGGPRVASAVGTPVVVISIGSRWSTHQVSPWMAPGMVVEPSRRCEGCEPFRCHGNGRTCIETLSPDQVIEAAARLLEA